MIYLRLFLLAGLLCHKLVWEALKPARGQAAAAAPASLAKRVVKLGKAAFLIFLLVQTLFLDLLPISQAPAAIRTVGVVLFIGGLALALAGRIQLGRNWANLEDYQVESEQALVTGGVYRYIRHPIYSGDIIMLVGLELALSSWLVLIIVVPLLVVMKQARAEEALLAGHFRDYDAYRRRTKRFIPFVM